MNHLARLRTGLATARAELDAKGGALQAFLVHLAGDKFAGTEPDGGRKDWISVTDVQSWLPHVRSVGA